MTDYRLWVSAAAAFAITVFALFALRPIAYALDLVDRPGGHKTHHGVVPVIGGLGILLGLVFGLASHAGAIGPLEHYVFSAVLLVVVGMADDRLGLNPGLRLIAQFCAVLPMFFGAGVRFSSFGDLLGMGTLDVGGGALVATAFVTIAAINASNMLDGLDGVAGGIALVAVALILSLPGSVAHPNSIHLLVVLSGSVIGFLVFNLPVRWNRRVRCFMGDAGSTLLGFSLAWVMIETSQGPLRMAAPVTMLWLVAVPAADLAWTVVRRLWRGQSPLRPDREHLHHMLLRAGLGPRAVFASMIGLAAVGGGVGLLLERAHVPDWVSFALLLAGGTLLAVLGRSAVRLVALWPAWLHWKPVEGQRGLSALPGLRRRRSAR